MPRSRLGIITSLPLVGVALAMTDASVRSADPLPQRPWTVSAAGPSARFGHATVYDSARNRVVLFGGVFPYNDDTWEWDGATWTEHVSAVRPPARSGAAMAYDAARGRTVLFGGVGPNAQGMTVGLADTWEFDGANWNPVTPATTSPPALEASVMIYDGTAPHSALRGRRS